MPQIYTARQACVARSSLTVLLLRAAAASQVLACARVKLGVAIKTSSLQSKVSAVLLLTLQLELQMAVASPSAVAAFVATNSCKGLHAKTLVTC